MLVQGRMLRIARQRAGLPQSKAASLLGVSQATLSRAEHQVIEVPEDLAVRAASFYKLPQAFFYQTDTIYGPPVSVHPAMWRKRSSVSARNLDRIIADLNLRTMHMSRLLESAEILPVRKVPCLDIDDYEDPEDVANILRGHWQVPLGPIADLTTLVESAGVVVAHSDLGRSAVDGVTFSVPGLPSLVVLNANQPADRMRFTLAHELGHLVMHRFPTPNMEQEANAFAGAFLLPARDLKVDFAGRRVDLARLAVLKPVWKVSMQSILMRASDLGVITHNQNRYLWRQISRNKMRLREPPELDFPVETPKTMRKLFDLHSGSLGYSIDDLADILCMESSELIDFHGLQPEAAHTEGPRLRLV